MIKSIPFYSSLIGEGTTNEILLYGLIEVLSYKDGYCYASSDYMAEQIGVTAGTVKNLLSAISKKGWIHVQVEGNKRVLIMPLLDIKNGKKSTEQPVEKPVENSQRASFYNDASVTLELRKRHARMTLSSEIEQGTDIINYNKIYKRNIKEKEQNCSSAGLAGNGPAGLSDKQKFQPIFSPRIGKGSGEEWEQKFYDNFTIKIPYSKLGANITDS